MQICFDLLNPWALKSDFLGSAENQNHELIEVRSDFFFKTQLKTALFKLEGNIQQ